MLSQIANSDNEALISELYEILKLETEASDPYILSPEQLSAVREAEEQIAAGQYLTHEQAQRDFEAWKGK